MALEVCYCLLMANLPNSNEKLLSVHGQDIIQVFCPVFHCHGLVAFRFALCKIKVTGHQLSQRAEFLLREYWLPKSGTAYPGWIFHDSLNKVPNKIK